MGIVFLTSEGQTRSSRGKAAELLKEIERSEEHLKNRMPRS